MTVTVCPALAQDTKAEMIADDDRSLRYSIVPSSSFLVLRYKEPEGTQQQTFLE